MITILATIFVLGILIFVHEVGHFILAKIFRIRVERFSLGYPPRLFGKKIGETDYCISLIPFGGYVKIAGMVDESMDKKQLEEEPKPWEFRSKPWIQKASVVLAGPLMNIALAFFIFVSATLIYGVGDVGEPMVGSVEEGKPAAMAGIRTGDRITAVDGIQVDRWETLAKTIRAAAGRTLKLEWIRNDSLFSAEVTPAREKVVDRGEIREVGLIGIGPQVKMRKASTFEALANGAASVYYLTKLVIVSFGKLITGQESIRSLAGPVFIAKMAGESARSGWGTLFGFMAFLSLNLGVLNLFPIPVLDGGHLMILGIEGIIRRDIPLKARMIVQQVFMVLLLGLMIFVIYNDVLRIFQK